MKIVKVSYKRTFSLGNYENFAVGIEAELNEGDTVEGALDELATTSLSWKNARQKRSEVKA